LDGGEVEESLLKRRERSAQAAQEAFLMANATLSLDERLSAHPQLKERVEAILSRFKFAVIA
jgi:hypothetical protein